MKSGSLFTLLFFLGAILLYPSLREDQDSLISHRTVPAKGRALASGMNQKCMRDLFTPEALKAEVQELEDSLDTNRLTGQWKHLDLSRLPTTAAVFLKAHGDQLGDGNGATDFSGCEDVPCLFNAVYGTPDGIAGYVHYLWYLRTGVYLAADNAVPEQTSPSPGTYNGKPLPLGAYLYSEDELYGFWRLGKMLKAPLSTLTYLKEIQRIPRGEKIEGANSFACGLAHSSGWIVLNDGCLIVNRRSDSGYFFPSVIHELTHQLDFEEGRRFNDDLYRSQRDDFLSMTGFELQEYRNSQGQLVRQWNLKPGFRLVSSYARNSPAENFAELLAYYRVDGDNTKNKVAQDSYAFAGEYYHGRKFEAQALIDRWVEDVSAGRSVDVVKAVSRCADPACLSRELTAIRDAEIGRIRSEEPDGCLILGQTSTAIRLPLSIDAGLNTVAGQFQSESTPELRQRLAENIDALLKPVTGYESFFSCHDAGVDCYEQEVAKRKSPELESYGDLAENVLAVYLWTFPFENVKKEVTTFYRSLLSSREGIMKRKADELWESCKNIPPSDSLPPQGSDYIVRDGYMVSSFYNCLNRGFQTMMNGSLDAVKLREFSPKNPQERAFIMGLLRPKMTAILDDKLRGSRANELKYRDAFVEQQGTWMYNTMRTNRWWVPRGRPDQATLEEACRTSALRLIGGEIYFHLKKELYRELLENTCRGIR